MKIRPKIGILALQGNFHQHAQLLEVIGAESVLIKTAKDLNFDIEGLILPGGESTTMCKIMKNEKGLREAILAFGKSGRPILGTCAGLILMSSRLEPEDPIVEPFG